MVKLNPGSNVHGDNETETAIPGMRNVEIPEPNVLENGKFQCPVCNAVFNSKEGYISHAMTLHQKNSEALEEPSKM